jgi:hypothetical protein
MAVKQTADKSRCAAHREQATTPCVGQTFDNRKKTPEKFNKKIIAASAEMVS